MATKISWNEFDYAAKDVIAGLLDEVGYSYREMEDLTHGEVTYNRIRDIRLGRRAPVRLSEFILLCSISHCTPLDGLQMVFDRVKESEQAKYDAMSEDEKRASVELFEEMTSQDSDEYKARHVTDLGLAAKHGDTGAEQAAYEEEP